MLAALGASDAIGAALSAALFTPGDSRGDKERSEKGFGEVDTFPLHQPHALLCNLPLPPEQRSLPQRGNAIPLRPTAAVPPLCSLTGSRRRLRTPRDTATRPVPAPPLPAPAGPLLCRALCPAGRAVPVCPAQGQMAEEHLGRSPQAAEGFRPHSRLPIHLHLEQGCGRTIAKGVPHYVLRTTKRHGASTRPQRGGQLVGHGIPGRTTAEERLEQPGPGPPRRGRQYDSGLRAPLPAPLPEEDAPRELPMPCRAPRARLVPPRPAPPRGRSPGAPLRSGCRTRPGGGCPSTGGGGPAHLRPAVAPERRRGWVLLLPPRRSRPRTLLSHRRRPARPCRHLARPPHARPLCRTPTGTPPPCCRHGPRRRLHGSSRLLSAL